MKKMTDRTIATIVIIGLLIISITAIGMFALTTGQILASSTLRCSDSDGGVTYNTAGVVSVCLGERCSFFRDYCRSNSSLQEYYCFKNKQGVLFNLCTNGCKDGACLPKPVR